MPKLVLGVIVVFLGFWMFTDPASLATTAESLGQTVWGATSAVFTALIELIRNL